MNSTIDRWRKALPKSAHQSEFVRIAALPRRAFALPPPELGDFERGLRLPGSAARLKPIQLAALLEARVARGLVGGIPVGEGKTLLSLLLPTVLGAERAVILIPSSMRAQFAHDYERHAKDWRILPPERLRAVIYSELSTDRGADALVDFAPQIIVADEAHRLRPSTTRTRRFRRYFRERPETIFCALSGTLLAKSIKDVAFLAALALRAGSPFPADYPTLEHWSAVLDPGFMAGEVPPGELLKFCNPGETARAGFRRRLIDTAGVVLAANTGTRVKLHLMAFTPAIPAPVESALKHLRAAWVLPGGEEIDSALDLRRHARELAAGFYYSWEWPNGVDHEWLEARSGWSRVLRAYLGRGRRGGLDSPARVERAIVAGRLALPAWAEWSAVADRPGPVTKTSWLSDYYVRAAIAWGRTNTGIIWFESPPLGRAIAKAGGFTYYGGGAKAARAILSESGARTIVASIRAHGEGKNLQMFHTQLVLQPPSGGKAWEQLLGRLDRLGQTAEAILTYLPNHTPEYRRAFQTAVNDSRFVHEIAGSPQKLLAVT